MTVKYQRGFSVVEFILALIVIAGITMAGIFAFSRFRGRAGNGSSLSVSKLKNLPDISYYQTHKSDQFIVNMDLVQTGFPFKGKRAVLPHSGAHAQFGDSFTRWPQGGTAPENYPPVYAPVDGYVLEVQNNFHDYSKNPVDLYSVKLGFAKSGSDVWSLYYSFEPFVKEPSQGFYAKFINVKAGEYVHKGQVIAYMYLTPKSGGGQNEHIHFQLNRDNSSVLYPPAIFTKQVVQDFHDHWAGFGVDAIHNDPSGTRIPACMGYKLSAEENPFGTGAVDCLI